MIYQLRSNLFFADAQSARKHLEALEEGFRASVVVHPDEPNQQGSSIEVIKCYHDETPTRPCEPIALFDCNSI